MGVGIKKMGVHVSFKGFIGDLLFDSPFSSFALRERIILQCMYIPCDFCI